MNINVTTFLNQLGYGIAGLNVVKAFARAGVDVALWVNGPGAAPHEDRAIVEQAIQRQATFDPDSPSLRISHQWDMAHSVGRGLRMGMTFFELDRLNPAEKHHLCSLDRLFIPSMWAGQVLAKNGVPDEIVHYAPLGVDRNIFNLNVQPAFPRGWESLLKTWKEANTTLFFNCGKWEVRKGHDILIEAFKNAFTKNDNVALVMNCSNPFLTENQAYEWEALYGRDPRLFVLPQRLPRQQDVAALMACVDCGVFPARAEGWNLELAEMMAMGKHVIATDYSAHTEFCTKENCYLIQPDGMEPAFDGIFFKGGRDSGEWAELGPQAMEQLVAALRDVHLRKQTNTLGVNNDGMETIKRFSWDNTVREILSVI